MPQISFTPRNSDVYDRFSRLMLEEQLKRGKLTAPQFLDLVLDKWEEDKMIAGAIDACMQSLPNVSLRAYVADAEANDPSLEPKNESQ